MPALDDVDGWLVGLPVARDDEDGGGASRENLLLPGLKEVPRRQRVVDRQRWRPVRYEESVHDFSAPEPSNQFYPS